MFGHIVTDADKGVFLHLCVDMFMCKDRLRMDGGGILTLFNIDCAVDERDRLYRTKLVAADIAQLFAATQLSFLRRKPVAVDRRCCSSTDRLYESETL